MEANNTDIQTKYQKVAAEYSKTRAQVTVLKKAVIDEQTKVTDLKDVMKERDQTIRKYEQEIDSLMFRNHQLAKRVTVLQDELETLQTKPKKNKNKSSDSGPYVSSNNDLIFNEELQSKIEENARLHHMLSEAEQSQQKLVDELTSRLENIQQESQRNQQALLTIHDQHKIVVDKLHHDKIQLEIKVQAQEKDVEELRLRSDKYEEQLQSVQQDLGDQLAVATFVLREHVPFNDTKRSELNALNIPTHNRKQQTQLRDLVDQVAILVHDLVTGLSNFHTYTEQRARVYSQDGDDRLLKHIHKKLAQHLHENASFLRPIEQSFLTFQRSLQEDGWLKLETAVGLQDFADKFSRYCAYLNKLLPYHLLSIEDECSFSSCTSTLEAKNVQYHASLSRLVAVFSKLDTYIRAIAAQSDQTQSYPISSQERVLMLLIQMLQDLQDAVKEASIHFNARVSLEHQLPTATQKLRTTDECILSSMISLVTCTAKLSTLMKSNLALIVKDSRGESPYGFQSSGSQKGCLKSSPAIGRFRKRAASYMTMMDIDQPKSVPYQEALHNQEILLSSTESRESLAKQLATSQDKIRKLEQAKEHWMLEFQLLQIKHEKDVKKLQRLEDQIRGGGDALSTISSGSSTDEVSMVASSNAEMGTVSPGTPSLLGKLDAVSCPKGDMREAEIKSYFTQHIKELVSQMQQADSKAVAYHAELSAMQRRLHFADHNRVQTSDQLVASHETVDRLKDELATTTKSYEQQLSMMSEHLANMNDKLTSQKDEIDELKYTISSMGTKKSKGK